MKTREEALNLLNEYVKSESLKRHCFSVAASMESYAEKFGEDKNKFWICGLLHDFDWEIHPDLERHPTAGAKILREKKVDEEIVIAILGHGNHTGVKRESLMAKTLFSVDELSGFVVAIARVKNGFENLDANSVRNAMKKKGFAAAINREDITQGILEMNVEENEHFEVVISALRRIRNDLGFAQ